MTDFIAISLSLVTLLIGAAWMTILPAIGTLYLLGMLK